MDMRRRTIFMPGLRSSVAFHSQVAGPTPQTCGISAATATYTSIGNSSLPPVQTRWNVMGRYLPMSFMLRMRHSHPISVVSSRLSDRIHERHVTYLVHIASFQGPFDERDVRMVAPLHVSRHAGNIVS